MIAVVLAVSVAMSGCATKLRNVPTQALSKQPVSVVERDHHDCEEAITGTLKGAWFPAEVEYASCLVARNYQVWVQVLDASVEMRKASLKSKIPPARIMSDMVTCEQFVQDKVTVAETVGRPVAGRGERVLLARVPRELRRLLDALRLPRARLRGVHGAARLPRHALAPRAGRPGLESAARRPDVPVACPHRPRSLALKRLTPVERR